MKKLPKLSPSKTYVFRRIQQSRHIHKVNRKGKLYSGGSFYSSKSQLISDSVKKGDDGKIHIELPESLDLVANYDETVSVVKTIKQLVLRDKKSIALIFNDVKKLSPMALMLLLAEIHRCRCLYGQSRVTGTYPRNKNIESILESSGFFKLLKVKPRSKSKAKTYPMEYIDFVSHIHEVKGSVRAFREAILGKDIKMSVQYKGRLYRAITEAMLNVRYHAYPVGNYKANPQRGRWWLSGHVNKRTKSLIIMFCDLGVGISNTLPKIHPMEIIRGCLSILPGVNPNDSEMIKAAMEIGRSQSHLGNRGKGLKDIKNFIDQVQSGKLEIFSNKGYYQYEYGTEPELRNHSMGIGGTLIAWTVPLEVITNWQGNGESYEQESH